MKKLLLFIVVLLQFSLHAQTIEPAPADKAVVYFVRASGLGVLVNFTYFDSTKVIGRFNGPKFMRYECEPGKHLFWARSENKDFVRADLEAGKIYVIDVIPVMGMIKAGLRLKPINSEKYRMKKIQKLLTRKKSEVFSEKDLESLQKKMEQVIIRGLDKARKMSGKLKTLGERTFLPEELLFVKKKRK